MSDAPDLDDIADEIKAAIEDETPAIEVVEGEPPKEKRTADDLADRRAKSFALHKRGRTYRQIGEELEVSIGTVKRDIDHSKKKMREDVATYDREDHIATDITIYNDIIAECWNVHTGADKETKLKALTLIKQTTQAREKSLQNNGVVRKEMQVQETVQISLVSKYDDGDLGKAAAALLAQGLNLHLAAPTPDIDEDDIEDAEIVEDEVDTDDL